MDDGFLVQAALGSLAESMPILAAKVQDSPSHRCVDVWESHSHTLTLSQYIVEAGCQDWRQCPGAHPL